MNKNLAQEIKINDHEMRTRISIGIEKNGFNLQYGTDKLNNHTPYIKYAVNNNDEHLIFSTAKEALEYVVNKAYQNSIINYVEATTPLFVSEQEIQQITDTKELKIY